MQPMIKKVKQNYGAPHTYLTMLLIALVHLLQIYCDPDRNKCKTNIPKTIKNGFKDRFFGSIYLFLWDKNISQKKTLNKCSFEVWEVVSSF